MNSLGERILRIDPPQPCMACNRKTNIAIATPEMKGCKQLSVTPECAWHGYNEVSPQEERASVERFVLAHFRDQGSARILKKVDVSEVPHYRPDTPARDPFMYVKERCWLVRYIDLENSTHDVYAVWSFSKLSFLLREPEAS